MFCSQNASVQVCLKVVKVSTNSCGYSLSPITFGLYCLYVHLASTAAEPLVIFCEIVIQWVQWQEGSHCGITYLPSCLSRVGKGSCSSLRCVCVDKKSFSCPRYWRDFVRLSSWTACLEACCIDYAFIYCHKICLLLFKRKTQTHIIYNPATTVYSSCTKCPIASSWNFKILHSLYVIQKQACLGSLIFLAMVEHVSLYSSYDNFIW